MCEYLIFNTQKRYEKQKNFGNFSATFWQLLDTFIGNFFGIHWQLVARRLTNSPHTTLNLSCLSCLSCTFNKALRVKELLYRVLKLQKSAARVILYADRQASSVALFSKLHWIPFYEQCNIAKGSTLYKRIHGFLPSYLDDHLVINYNRH